MANHNSPAHHQRSHREQWRQERLAAERVAVRVPIRYGRISADRGGTYTMVFSNELTADRLGSGIAVPCRRRIRDGIDLAGEAEALWGAEQTTARPTGRVSATWGAVGLLCNPNTSDLESIRTSWMARTAQEQQNYREFPHTNSEVAALDPGGMLNISWPETRSGALQGLDMLLATATRPNCLADDAYPSASTVATAWVSEPEQAQYFHENRRAGITTFDDPSIVRYIEER